MVEMTCQNAGNDRQGKDFFIHLAVKAIRWERKEKHEDELHKAYVAGVSTT
jgi:hypothetical protein